MISNLPTIINWNYFLTKNTYILSPIMVILSIIHAILPSSNKVTMEFESLTTHYLAPIMSHSNLGKVRRIMLQYN